MPHVHLRTIFTFRAITHYTDLPDSYEDAQGLPFRKEDLNQREANQIFSSNLPAPQANLLLKILHGRRVAGTLDDPTLVRNTGQFRITDQKRALEYLREHIPVDEVLNAGLRAEDELRLIEEEENTAREAEFPLEATRSREPLSDTPNETAKAPTGRLPWKRGSDSPYGESNFDRIRAENIARREAEEARLEEERKRKEEELAKGNIGTLQTQQEKPKELSPFRKKHLERATSDLEAPPEMKAWQRLLPTVAMATLVVLGSMGFATLYQAPPASRRLLPDIPPAAATCLALIGANLAIWALWKFPPAWAVLNRYMILIAATPRPLQVVGAMFSHHSFGHLAANMTFLWFFGTRIHDEIGRGNFLALYFSSGAVGFAVSLAHLVLWRGLDCTTLGASGAVYGLITAFFWMHKFDEFKVFGYPPDPISGPQGLGFLGLIVGMHLVPLFSKRVHNIDMASHFGGMLAGAIGIDLARGHMNYRARIRAERLKCMGVGDAVIETRQISPPPVGEAPPSLPTKR
jgi:rhomboid-like protein